MLIDRILRLFRIYSLAVFSHRQVFVSKNKTFDGLKKQKQNKTKENKNKNKNKTNENKKQTKQNILCRGPIRAVIFIVLIIFFFYHAETVNSYREVNSINLLFETLLNWICFSNAMIGSRNRSE